MLIEVIEFEIRDFKNGTAEQFVVENNELNFSMIASHKKTREITFKAMFEFEFIAKESVPKFIRFGEAVADSFKKEIAIDEIDEMVGMYI